MNKIGIVCSGGDAPGINNVINKLYFELIDKHIKILGFLDGFQGIYQNNFKVIDLKDIDGIQFSPGSIIGCERFPQFIQSEVFNKIISNLKDNEISDLIIFGGNGSFEAAKLLNFPWLRIHFIPTTVDNDIEGIKNTLGFKTALNSIVSAISIINNSALNHQKINIVEVMGRRNPDLAEWASLACNSDFVITSKNYQNDNLYEDINNTLKNCQKRSPIIIVSEKLIDINILVNKIDSPKGKWVNILGHLQRGGIPVYDDLILGNLIAKKIALNIIKEKTDLIYRGE